METLEKKGKGSALFPFLLFIIIYLGAGLYFQFKDVEMACLNELFKIGEEERNQQIADMQSVHVGIGCDHHFVVAEIFDVLFDVERAHDAEKLFDRIDRFQFFAETVERLSLESEHRLRVGVTALDH